MIEIKRRIKKKTKMYPVYTQKEALDKNIVFVYWKECNPSDWGLTDDGYVSKCYDRNNYTDKNGNTKTFIKLTCGVGWNSSFSKINFETNHGYNSYSKINPSKTWDEQESKTTRAKNTVSAYTRMLLSSDQVDFDVLGKIYRPDQKTPAATVRRFLKQKVVKDMVEEKLKDLLAKKSINKEFAVDNLVSALHMAESKGDVNNFLKANEQIMDLLEMKPSKKTITDTIQVDLSKQIADTIATEEKKLLVQHKEETDEKPRDL
tara:strand:- start:11191 stop:11973 length:783 start_codon:yes stop_codon:yes gene_type:complete